MPPANLPKTIVGRDEELRRLRTAVGDRQSLLIWGPAGAGKTSLVASALGDGNVNSGCLSVRTTSIGMEGVKPVVAQIVREPLLARDPVVRKQIRTDTRGEASMDGWLRAKTSGQLKSALYAAVQRGRYCFFWDDFPPATPAVARFIKTLIWRCRTPVYILARGCSPAEIGHAWSVYFAPELHIRLGPLADSAARELLERSIVRFGLGSLDLRGFREEVLKLSGRIPGSIVRMCELASDPQYRSANQVMVKLIHIDRLMSGGPPAARPDERERST